MVFRCQIFLRQLQSLYCLERNSRIIKKITFERIQVQTLRLFKHNNVTRAILTA